MNSKKKHSETKLRALYKASGLSQRQIAKACSLPFGSIKHMLNGDTGEKYIKLYLYLVEQINKQSKQKNVD